MLSLRKVHLVTFILLGSILLAACAPDTPQILNSTISPPPPSIIPTDRPATATPPPSSPTTQPPPSAADTAVPTATVDPRLSDVPVYIIDASLSWDPTGQWLAYTTSDGRAWMQLKTGKEALEIPHLQAAPPAELRTAWSPGGEQLLVYGVWGFDYPRWTALWLVPMDVAGPGRAFAVIPPIQPEPPVFQNEGVVYAASWAPDGMSFAYTYLGEAWTYTIISGENKQITQITSHPLRSEEQPDPFNGIREIAYSPVGDSLAIGLTCNCPSPTSGLAFFNLANYELRFIGGSRLNGWSPDGRLVTFENVTGDWAGDYTFDTYGVDPNSVEITNLTASNPDYDPLFDSWEAFKPSAYQTQGLHWLSPDLYAYTTLDFNLPQPPAAGFIVRESPEKIHLDRRATAEAWYLAPAWLPGDQIGYLELEPGHPEPADLNANVYLTRRVVLGSETLDLPGLAINRAVWAPDGTALALIVVSEPGKPENALQILSLEGDAE